MFRAGAEGRVALGLVLAEVVRAHGLQAKPEQVKALVQEAAQTYEQPEAVVRWHYEKPERLNEFESHGGRTQRRGMGARPRAGRGQADRVRRADGNSASVGSGVA